MDNLKDITNPSLQARRQLFEKSLKLAGKQRFDCVVAMLATPYKDLREAVLDSCSDNEVQNWENDFIDLFKSFDPNENELQTQAILVLLQRLKGKLCQPLANFCHECLKSQHPDVQYQAFCLAELQEETSDKYLDAVRKFLHSNDEDIRIVAIQALDRLKPNWAYNEIVQLSQNARELEAFHALLALVHLSSEEQRKAHVLKMSQYLQQERYCFVAIQCLFEYGVSENIDALIQVAKNFFGEPTSRVAAAAAAARLGSEEGKKLLQKFSQSRHGNPNYARELIEKLKQLH